MNNHFLKKFSKPILFVFLFAIPSFAAKEESSFVKTTADREKWNKADIKALLWQHKKVITGGLCGIGALIAFLLYKNTLSQRHGKKKDHRRKESQKTEIKNGADNNSVIAKTSQVDTKIDNEAIVKNHSDLNTNPIDLHEVGYVINIEDQAKLLHEHITNYDTDYLKKASKLDNFKELCEIKINGKNAGELIFYFTDKQLKNSFLSDFIEYVYIDTDTLHVLINLLVEQGIIEQEYRDVLILLFQQPNIIDVLKKNDEKENRRMFEEIWMNLIEGQLYSSCDIEVLLVFIKAGIKITAREFKELYSLIRQVRWIGLFKTKECYILFHNYVKHHGHKKLYKFLVEIKIIEKHDTKTKLEQLLAMSWDKDSELYKLLFKKQEKVDKKNGAFYLFELIRNHKKEDFIKHLKELKTNKKNPLEIIEHTTGKTILHYIMAHEQFCTNEVFDLIFSFDDNKKIIWHENIARIDKENRTFLDYAKSENTRPLVQLFSLFDENDTVLVKDLLEREHDKKQIIGEFLMRAPNIILTIGNVEFFYLLLSYAIFPDTFDNYFKTEKTNSIRLLLHMYNFNTYYEKLPQSMREIIIHFIKKELSEHKINNQKFYMKDILNSSDTKLAKEFLIILFDPWIKELQNSKNADSITLQIYNILKDYTQKNIKNCSLLVDTFDDYLEFDKKFRSELLDLALQKQNSDMTQKLLFRDYLQGKETHIKNQELSAFKDDIAAILLSDEHKEFDYNGQLYINLLHCVFKKNISESDEYQKNINQIKELIHFAYDKRKGDFFSRLLLFCKEHEILKKIWPDFTIFQLFKHYENNEEFDIAMQNLIDNEFILYIQNKNSFFKRLDLFTIETCYLKKYGIKKNRKSKNFLHYAIIENNKTVVKLLIASEIADELLIQRDEIGNTPLHYVQELSILLDVAYYGRVHKQNIFDLKNRDGKTILGCFFKGIDEDSFNQIFKQNIFKIKKNNIEEYKSIIWLALLKESFEVESDSRRNQIRDYCKSYIDYRDAEGLICVMQNYPDPNEFLTIIKQKNRLLLNEANEIISYCVNCENEEYLEKNLERLNFYFECINKFDIVLFSLATRFHTEKLFEKFKDGIKDECKNNDNLQYFVKKLINNNEAEIIKLILAESKEFLLFEDDIKKFHDYIVGEGNYVIKQKYFDLAQLFADKANSILDIEYIKKIITSDDNTNAEQYIVRNRGKIIKGRAKELGEYRSKNKQETLLHLYKLPLDLMWKKNSLLYLFLKDPSCNFNFFAKDKYQVPAIIALCSNIEYRKYIDWWVSEKLSNENGRKKFVKKISDQIEQLEKKVSESNNQIKEKSNNILFYFTSICRLKKSTHRLDLKDMGIEKENIENSTNLLGALFYYVNFIRDTKEDDDARLMLTYSSIKNTISADKNDKQGSINIELLRDPVFNITLLENSKFMKDHKPCLEYN